MAGASSCRHRKAVAAASVEVGCLFASARSRSYTSSNSWEACDPVAAQGARSAACPVQKPSKTCCHNGLVMLSIVAACVAHNVTGTGDIRCRIGGAAFPTQYQSPCLKAAAARRLPPGYGTAVPIHLCSACQHHAGSCMLQPRRSTAVYSFKRCFMFREWRPQFE